MTAQPGSGVAWDQTSPADYDKRLAVRGHKRPPADQGGLFYVPTPTRDRKPATAEQLDGQGALFGGDDDS